MKYILLILVSIVLLQPAAFAQQAKASNATGSRKVAYVTLKSNAVIYEPQDSTHYTYSGTRDIDPVSGMFKYDNGLMWNYNNTTQSYENNYRYTHTFDANDNIVLAFYEQWNTTTSAWESNGQTIYTYDAANNLLTEIYQFWNSSTNSWDNYYKKTYTYDANNNKLTYTYQMWGVSSWTNNYQALYSYNASNQLVQTITQNWVTATNTWKNGDKTLNAYDANNNLSLVYGLHWNTTTTVWDSSSKGSYTYNASNNLITELHEYWNSSINGWENLQKIRYSNFVGSYPQSIIKQHWNGTGFDNEERRLLTYNTYGQVLTEYYDSWNIGGFWQATTSDYGYHHYYEEYATDVKSLSSIGGDATLYPVPAKDMLYIDLHWSEPQAFTISIIDLQGRASRQMQLPASTQYHAAISVSELPFGTYIVKIDGTKGHLVKQLIVSPK